MRGGRRLLKKLGQLIASYWRTTDRWLLLLWLSASGVSVVFLWNILESGLISSDERLTVQAASIASGLLCAVVISCIDYRFFLRLWKLYVPACVVLVLLTWTPLGVVRGGDRAWLAVPFTGGTIQPSEFLKLCLITTLSIHLTRVKDKLNAPMNILLLCLHGGAYVLLIQLQDSGSALVFLGIFLFMMFFAGVSWKYIAAALATAAAALPLLWYKVMTPDQKIRILILFDSDLLETLSYQEIERYTYQQYWGIRALGTGGLKGVGLFQQGYVSTMVPEVYNDFIFAFIGEVAGFVGCLGVIVLLGSIAMKVLYNSARATDDEGRMLCIGVFGMLLSQIFINLGMCLSLTPVIGVTLPLFSSGGSSVLSLYIALGLVLSTYLHTDTGLFSERK